MEMKFQFKEISAALLDWDLKEFHQTHEAWKVFDWKSNIVYMTLPGGIFLSLFLSDSVCVSHASCDFLLSVFHQFVRVDAAPPGGWHGETGNRFREGGIKKPPVGSSGLWPCATLCVTVCMWEHRTVTGGLFQHVTTLLGEIFACCCLLTCSQRSRPICLNYSTMCVHINKDPNIDRNCYPTGIWKTIKYINNTEIWLLIICTFSFLLSLFKYQRELKKATCFQCYRLKNYIKTCQDTVNHVIWEGTSVLHLLWTRIFML